MPGVVRIPIERNARQGGIYMNAITEQMKRDTWTFYVFASSNDPQVMVPYTRKLISNLFNEMQLQNDTSYLPLMVKCIKEGDNAWYIYKELDDWAQAMQLCERILDRIRFLIYDKDGKWATTQADSHKIGLGKVN